jgi:hypothetical protein
MIFKRVFHTDTQDVVGILIKKKLTIRRNYSCPVAWQCQQWMQQSVLLLKQGQMAGHSNPKVLTA